VIHSQADLSDRLARLPNRSIIAIAGPPGAGKSTLAEALATSADDAAVLPMDGFHFDDAILRDRGRLPWKGAPDTFDVGGLAAMLKRLSEGEDDVAVPVFDRELEISRGSARIIPASTRLIIVEGNYLLLRAAPWSELAPFFALTVMIDVAEDDLRQRLTDRWRHYGLDDAAIRHKLEGNDIPNGRTVYEGSRPADIVLRQT
jgi:pantothenate kinase